MATTITRTNVAAPVAGEAKRVIKETTTTTTTSSGTQEGMIETEAQKKGLGQKIKDMFK